MSARTTREATDSAASSDWHYLDGAPNVSVVLRRHLTIWLLVATLPAFGNALTAAPRDVVADYFKDGKIDMAYSINDLRGALVFARRHTSTAPQYSAFADAVNQAITDALVGSGDAAQQQLTIPRSRTEVSPPPAPAPVPAPSNLPAPPQGAPTDSIPWIVPMMAILAGVLVLAGIGSSVWRRVRR